MSITDELRKYTDDLDRKAAMKSEHGFSPVGMRLESIADHIDEEHERLMSEQYKSLTIDMQPMTEENMAKSGWLRLPVDADGKVIDIGDVVDTEHFGTVEVAGFVHGAVAFYNYSGQPAYICTSPANLCHHHHESTVEDLLADVADRAANLTGSHNEGCMNGDEYMDSMRALVAEYATKFRLADDGEEQ